MEMRYMTYKNEEGQKERFYPITHKDAIVGLSDIPEVSENDLISTEAASEIVGDAPEIDPAIVDLVNNLTAEDVGALPIKSGTLSGNELFLNSGNGVIRCYGDLSAIETRDVKGSDANRRNLAIENRSNTPDVKNAVWLNDAIDGKVTGYRIYGEHNKDFMPFLPLTGGTMTGTLFTNTGGVVPCSKELTGTMEEIVYQARHSSGMMGSFNLTTDFIFNNITMPATWYNYLYIPHRCGGVGIDDNSDNHNYGKLLLFPMTNYYDDMYIISVKSGNIERLTKK